MGAKTNAPKRAAAPSRVTLASLAARVDALEAEVAALRAKAAPKRLDAAAVAALGTTLLGAIGDLDARQRFGGLVPLPDLRRELRARNVEASDADVSDALLALERDFKIDLSIAQSPTTVADRGSGIERPGRGLLYYVTRR
ncbi:MAG TPA: hypothetical protein VL463_29150 [Kofleriaceae bacterium]|nr:hypothetical protein [Kofleriaceae bacterium]